MRGRVIVIGAGTNFLFVKKQLETDTFVSLKKFNKVAFENNKVTVGAGVLLPTLIALAKKNSLGGLEFTYPVPASVGGAVYQNFGAYGKEICNYVASVRAYDFLSGKFLDFDTSNNQDKFFSYRDSYFKQHKLIITAISLTLEKSDSENIKNLLKEVSNKRHASYPNRKTCGSVFKNGNNFFAGKLLEDAGFKGYKQGNVQISSNHANVIICTNNATCLEIYKLIQNMKQTVYDKFQVELEVELMIY